MHIWSTPEIEGAIGFASYPWSVDTQVDGVKLDAYTMLGNAPQGTPFNLGRTLIHEAGHWLGLVHTFQGGCVREGILGLKHVNDVPAQRDPSSGCPVGRDSCTGKPGFDPIDNFMDYSDDSCYKSFSPGQLTLMRANYKALRLP